MRQKILVFAKAPVAGQVKTRLILALGAEGAAALQRRLLHRTLQLTTSSRLSTELWCSPTKNHPAFNEFHQHYNVEWENQHGSNLGERMSHAFSKTLCSVDAAILIGNDCPELRKNHLQSAFEKLDQGNDVVLGPARDGGYVLIGLKQSLPGLFKNIPWGSAQVLSATREKIRESKLNWSELPTTHDLDRPSDLELFPELL
ncbi:MAG TPA: glycosyltransferase [Chromatiales bacterium]|nr:glycosyltransferase [Thiotrichales bacterium]HIP67495.1 glycosyltransferase [Chromatiales bacterium]